MDTLKAQVSVAPKVGMIYNPIRLDNVPKFETTQPELYVGVMGSIPFDAQWSVTANIGFIPRTSFEDEWGSRSQPPAGIGIYYQSYEHSDLMLTVGVSRTLNDWFSVSGGITMLRAVRSNITWLLSNNVEEKFGELNTLSRVNKPRVGAHVSAEFRYRRLYLHLDAMYFVPRSDVLRFEGQIFENRGPGLMTTLSYRFGSE